MVSFDGEKVYGSPKNDSIPVDGLTVYIEASEMSDTDKLSFQYEVKEFSETKLNFKLHFDNPPSVSSTTEKDMMVVQLRNFRDPNGKLISESDDIRREVPN